MEESGIAGAVADWEPREVRDGYRGLADLAESSFSGAIAAGNAWLLFINGRAVGAYLEHETADGYDHEPATLDRFEGADLTAHAAPAAGLPLLFTMQLSDAEVVERGFTKERPIREVDAELQEAGFTGYLELSEQVVSGDYYVVYQAGRSMNLAFTGPSRRVRTGEEAFERTCEEVGLFEVRAVELSVLDIPEPDQPADTGGVAAAGDTTEPDTGGAEPAAAPERGTGGEAADPQVDERAGAVDAEAPAADDGGVDGAADDGDGAVAAEPAADGDAGAVEPGSADADESGPELIEGGESPDPAPEPQPDPGADTDESPRDPPDAAPAAGGDATGRADPDAGTTDEAGTAAEPVADADDGPDLRTGPLADRVDRLVDRQERTAATVRELEERLDRLVGRGDTPVEAEQTVTPEVALEETTILVHYRSGSGPTLEAVREGATDRAAFADNLLLDPQTPFPADRTAVAGEAYGRFLRSTLEYRFVEWLLTEFTFELRDSRVRSKLRALDEAFPTVARAEFGANAAVDGTDFDVVLRTREDSPLVVANLHDATDPPSESTTEAFIRDASATGEAAGTLAGAFLVTTSFVDGAATDPVQAATRSRLLGRDRRKSYVALSSGGFHLFLVESGGETFHVAVPSI